MKKAVIYFDGGTALRNPGKASCAATVEVGGQMQKFGKALGWQTNNVAEWEGLLLGLSEALAMGVEEVEVYGDSNLVINQAAGRWTAKAENMQQMQARCKELKKKFIKSNFTWIPREKNAIADAICNQIIKDTYNCQPFDSAAAQKKEKKEKAAQQAAAVAATATTTIYRSSLDIDPQAIDALSTSPHLTPQAKALIATMQDQIKQLNETLIQLAAL